MKRKTFLQTVRDSIKKWAHLAIEMSKKVIYKIRTFDNVNDNKASERRDCSFLGNVNRDGPTHALTKKCVTSTNDDTVIPKWWKIPVADKNNRRRFCRKHCKDYLNNIVRKGFDRVVVLVDALRIA